MAMPKINPVLRDSAGVELTVTYKRTDEGKESNEETDASAAQVGTSDMQQLCSRLGIPVQTVNVKTQVENKDGSKSTVSRKFHSPDFEKLASLPLQDGIAKVATWYTEAHGITASDIAKEVLGDVSRAVATDTGNAIRQTIGVTPEEREKRAVNAQIKATTEGLETNEAAELAREMAEARARILAKRQGANAGSSASAAQATPPRGGRPQQAK